MTQVFSLLLFCSAGRFDERLFVGVFLCLGVKSLIWMRNLFYLLHYFIHRIMSCTTTILYSAPLLPRGARVLNRVFTNT